jgi:hypothetical protein
MIEEFGADISITDNDGMSPLHWAAQVMSPSTPARGGVKKCDPCFLLSEFGFGRSGSWVIGKCSP